MPSFHFELVSPERLLFQGEVESVIVPGQEGELTVMAGHAPLVTPLRAGLMLATRGDGRGEEFYVQGGLAEIGPRSLTILAERASGLHEVSRDSLERDITSAAMRRDGARTIEEQRRFDEQVTQLTEFRDALAVRPAPAR